MECVPDDTRRPDSSARVDLLPDRDGRDESRSEFVLCSSSMGGSIQLTESWTACMAFGGGCGARARSRLRLISYMDDGGSSAAGSMAARVTSVVDKARTGCAAEGCDGEDMESETVSLSAATESERAAHKTPYGNGRCEGGASVVTEGVGVGRGFRAARENRAVRLGSAGMSTEICCSRTRREAAGVEIAAAAASGGRFEREY